MGAVDFARFVDELAQASGEAILPFFRTHLGAEDKSRGGVFDPVTEADKAAEIIMRRMIEDAFPAHGIIGEEFGTKNEDADYVWVLDPIDGTRGFVGGRQYAHLQLQWDQGRCVWEARGDRPFPQIAPGHSKQASSPASWRRP